MWGNFIYVISVFVLVSGLFIIVTSDSYIRKIIGLSVFQTSVLLFYVALGKRKGSVVPILKCYNFEDCPIAMSSPLPHVLMLTAIVVGLATMSVGIALIYKIYDNFNTINESEIDWSDDSSAQDNNLS